DLELDVEAEEVLRADADAFAFEGLVSLDRRLDGVLAGVERREGVLADAVGHRFARDVVRFVDDRDARAGNDALCVLDDAAQTTLEGLGEKRSGRYKYCDEDPDRRTHNPHGASLERGRKGGFLHFLAAGEMEGRKGRKAGRQEGRKAERQGRR